MPSRALMVPDGSRTESPRHFSVKNIVPSGRKAMSHVSSRPDMTVVLVRTGTWAAADPDWTNEASSAQGKTKRICRVIDVASRFLVTSHSLKNAHDPSDL